MNRITRKQDSLISKEPPETCQVWLGDARWSVLATPGETPCSPSKTWFRQGDLVNRATKKKDTLISHEDLTGFNKAI